jgi:alcohol dehydrogenase
VTTGETTNAGVVANQLYPDVALLDAELTLGLPGHITAATGVDAMVHCIEAYTSARLKNPYADMLAKEGLRLLSQNIMTATFDGSKVEARQAMLLGACLGGQSFANAPVAAVHALAYPLGGHYHIPHGLSNSLVLPHVMRFNAPKAATLYAELAPIIMGKAVDGDAAAVTEQLIIHIEKLILDLKLPNTLKAMDIPESDLPMLASDGMKQQRLLINNPREVTEADALAIYQAAY